MIKLVYEVIFLLQVNVPVHLHIFRQRNLDRCDINDITGIPKDKVRVY